MIRNLRPGTIFLMAAICLYLLAGTAFAAPANYAGQFRPGVITGNSAVGTDFNLDILLPLYGDERQILFFNPNFRFDDNDGNEQNIGFGYRLLSSCGHFILGGNAYYDTMKSEMGHRYQQWGVGAEILSQWVDLRANYYKIFGDDDNSLGSTASGNNGYYFSGNSLIGSFGLLAETEEALDGYDAEVSVLVPGLSAVMETRLAATYYRFDSDYGQDPDGWRGRIEARPVQALNLIVEYRDDDLRGSDTFYGGYLEIPFSLENLFVGRNPFAGAGDLWAFGKGTRQFKQRMTDKVVRDRHIVTVQSKVDTREEVTVVDDVMIFVNQDNSAAGDGSYENPYQTLDQAATDELFQPGAWIYVFSSDDTADTYAETHFTLLDDMVLWGQGYEHPVYGLGGGPAPILDGGYDGTTPIVDYAAASVIVLADNNEVMGLTIQNGFEGIYGSNITGTNIHHNLIRWNPDPSSIIVDASGIHISNLFSPSEVNNQSLNYMISDNQIIDNGSVGIFLKHEIDGGGNPISNLTINNSIAGNTLYGNYNSSSDPAANANIYVGNTVYGGDVSDLTVNNTFTENILSSCANSPCLNRIDNGIKLKNEIDLFANYYAEGVIPNTVTVFVYDGDITNAKFVNSFIGNDISGLQKAANYTGNAIFMEQSMHGANISDALSENTFTDNIIRSNDGTAVYSTQNSFRSFGDESVFRRAEYTNGDPVLSPGAITNTHQVWNLSNNRIEDNGRDGFHANNDYFSNGGDHYINSSTEFYFRDNRITNNGRSPQTIWDNDLNGIYIYSDTSQDKTSRKFFLQGNLLANNNGDGVDYYWNVSNPATMQADFGGGSLGSTGGNAFFGNTGYDINQDNNTYTTNAANNWWGQAEGPDATKIYEPGLLNSSSPLSTNPF